MVEAVVRKDIVATTEHLNACALYLEERLSHRLNMLALKIAEDSAYMCC